MKQKKLPLILIACCLIFIQPTYLFSTDRLEITHGPYLIDPAEDAITVVWFTNKVCVSEVEYCSGKSFGTFPTWGGYPKTARNSHHGLIDANTTRHVIRLTNLKPGTAYRYRISSKEITRFNPYEVIFGDSVTGEVLEFSTLDPEKTEFTFGVIADVHERAADLDTLLQTVDTKVMDMIFLTGDILNWMGDEERIFNGFLDVSVENFAKETPFIFVRGNHETRGSFARHLMDYVPISSGRFYYSFVQGNVHFTVLDSGEDKPDTHPVYAGIVDFDSYRTEQAEWLAQEVKSKAFQKAQYKIVILHIPPYYGDKHGSSEITKKWGPIFNEAGIDLTISGHHHRFAYKEKTKNENDFSVLIIGKDMLIKTDVTKKQLHLTITDKFGKIIDRKTIPSNQK